MKDAKEEMKRKWIVTAGYVRNSQSPRLWSNYVITRGLDRGETQTHIYLTWKRWFVPSHSHLSVCVVL